MVHNVGCCGIQSIRSDTIDVTNTPQSFSVVLDVASTSSTDHTSAVDVSSLAAGVRYYYYLRAYLSDGNMSDPSDTINYYLLAGPALEGPPINGSVNSTGLSFHWADGTGGGYTVIHVKDTE